MIEQVIFDVVEILVLRKEQRFIGYSVCCLFLGFDDLTGAFLAMDVKLKTSDVFKPVQARFIETSVPHLPRDARTFQCLGEFLEKGLLAEFTRRGGGIGDIPDIHIVRDFSAAPVAGAAEKGDLLGDEDLCSTPGQFLLHSLVSPNLNLSKWSAT